VLAQRTAGGPAVDVMRAYSSMSPEGDQRVFADPEIEGMFIDDIRFSSGAAARPSSTMPAYSGATGVSGWPTSRRRCGGGTATPTLTCPSPLPKRRSRACPTPSSSCARARAISAASPRLTRCWSFFANSSERQRLRPLLVLGEFLPNRRRTGGLGCGMGVMSALVSRQIPANSRPACLHADGLLRVP